jgi:hypothetical protein
VRAGLDERQDRPLTATPSKFVSARAFSSGLPSDELVCASDMPCSASVRWFICVALCEVLGLRVQLHTHHSQRSCASVSRVGDLSMQVDRSKLRKVPCPAVQCPAPSHAQLPVA